MFGGFLFHVQRELEAILTAVKNTFDERQNIF